MNSYAWILVTGSRSLRQYRLVADALDQAWTEAREQHRTRLIVVHGAASGADAHAERWAQEHKRAGVDCRRFPADWEADCTPHCQPGHRRPRRDSHGTYCPAEGHYRNQRMVDHVIQYAEPGSARVLAFHSTIQLPNSGTSHCARRAEAAGLPVRHFEAALLSKEPSK